MVTADSPKTALISTSLQLPERTQAIPSPLPLSSLPLFASTLDQDKYKFRKATFLELAQQMGNPTVNIAEVDPQRMTPYDLDQVGYSRILYLAGVNRWTIPLDPSGRDISTQDYLETTIHHLLKNSAGELLASCRTTTGMGYSDVGNLPFLATTILNGSELNGHEPTVNELLKRRAEQSVPLEQALSSGKVGTIERLVPGPALSINSPSTDRKDAIILAQAYIGGVAISAAAYLKSLGINHVIIQADDRYLKHYREILGIEDSDIVCTKEHSLVDGTPDNCHTFVLRIDAAERYTEKFHPDIYQYYCLELNRHNNLHNSQ